MVLWWCCFCFYHNFIALRFYFDKNNPDRDWHYGKETLELFLQRLIHKNNVIFTKLKRHLIFNYKIFIMKKLFTATTLVCLFLLLIILTLNNDNSSNSEKSIKKKPNDWFFRQRAFPQGQINYEAYKDAIDQANEFKERYKSGNKGVSWEFVGPLNTGGRISAVAMHPDNMDIFYVGAASGGVFKTEDGGASWEAIFDDQPSLSIGDVALAPSNPEIIYVGTGEANAGGGSLAYDGLGIFRSDDGGNSWIHLGLDESGSIGRLVVHPANPDICYVAAMGRLFSNNDQRGVFKTTNGGTTWENVLFLSDSTGAIDIVIHPEHPDTIYAAMWERVRRPSRRSYGGPTCGLYRTYDGGNNWTELTNGLPSPSPNVGRIGVSISQSDPEILYTIYADKIGYFDGVYKTTNNGDSWNRVNDGALSYIFASYGWWFGRIRVDPTDPDIVYGIGFDLYKSSNGGNSWSNISGWYVHVDQHGLNAHPLNNNFVVLGNDGGVYISQNGGSSFTHLENLPITQFYTSEVDNSYPSRFYGGTQDNGTIRTMTGSADDWTGIYGGDGFYVLVDPENNNYVYAEYQYGGLGRSTNGGSSFVSATSGISYSDRFNWMSPVVFNLQNPSTLYFGGNRLYKSTNRAVSWQAISPDLSNGAGSGNLVYGTITTISVSPVNTQIIYTGTDDGNVWVSQNDGGNWTKISDELPERWVTRVVADPYNENVAYVTFSGYRYDDYLPHIYRTEDLGENWSDISGDLPEAPINDIIIDPSVDSALYIATDVGVFVTWNLGQNWGLMGEGLPNLPMCDLTLHNETRMLAIGTYGRSMYKIDLDEFVGLEHKEEMISNLKIYPNPVKDILHFRIQNSEKALNYKISDLTGKTVASGIINPLQTDQQIDVSNLKHGQYILSVICSGQKHVRKFVKN